MVSEMQKPVVVLLLAILGLIAAALLDPGLAVAATVADRSPTSATGTNWGTPANVYSSDNLRATYSADSQNDLRITSFDFSAIPDTAIIDGITVKVEGYQSSWTASDRQYRIGLTKNGSILAGTRKTAITMNQGSDTTTIRGSNIDKWGASWSAAEVKATTFGVLFSDNDTNPGWGSNGTFYVDQVTLTVDYHLPPDTTAPTVGTFIIPSTSTSLTVPVTTFTASDNTAVTGYLITESATPPAAGAAGWTASAPANYVFVSEGAKSLYAWAKDAAGNVSAYVRDTVLVDGTPPTVTSFTVPATSNSLTVAISSFAATDAIGVTGYLVTESIIPPAAGAAGWSATPPTYYVFSSEGSKTLYAWAKDGNGNVSTSRNASVTVTANGTSAGLAAVNPVGSGIRVEASYAGDNNANNTLRIEWDQNGDDWLSLIGSTTLPHGTSPYGFGITGLTDGTSYQVRITYLDADGVGGSAVQTFTGVIPGNPMLHNSRTTNSSKWAVNNGWGVVGGKYGKFDCNTCHLRPTGNIKMIAATITAPNSPVDNFPGGVAAPVAFTSTEDGAADLGNDAGGHGTSVKICEVCHSRNQFHNYNTANNTGGTGHFNQADCINCHQHNKGFEAACDTCHGYPPTVDTASGGPNGLDNTANGGTGTGSTSAGKHAIHTSPPLSYVCNTCHNGWESPGEMPKTDDSGDINIGFSAFGSTAGSYSGQSGVAYNTAPGSGTMQCTNVYCHSVGNGVSATVWDGSVACGNCHAAIGGATGNVNNLPSGISHATHAKTQNRACLDCHGAGYVSGSATPANHVDGGVAYDVSSLPASSGTVAYSKGASPGTSGVRAGTAAYGTCANVACHYGNTTPPWNGSFSGYRCTNCHNDGTVAQGAGSTINAAPNSGAHKEHLDGDLLDAGFVSNLCEDCHGSGATNGAHAGHGDVTTNVVLGGQISSYNTTDKTCVNTCHRSDTAATKWDLAGQIQCDDCHRPGYIGPAVVWPDNSASGKENGYGSHLKAALGDSLTSSTNWQVQCAKCHPTTHSGGVTVPLPSADWAVTGAETHVTGNMQTALGIAYNTTDGIHLGGAGTVASISGKTTEAEICWGCHDSLTTRVSEWGYNTTNAIGFPVVSIASVDDGTQQAHNFGWLYTNNSYTTKTSDWTASGAWRKDGYLHPTISRPIASIHTAYMGPDAAGRSSSVSANVVSGKVKRGAGSGLPNPDASAPVLENKQYIRCSYCHDVHDTIGPNKKPYLRGTWMSNPYPPDVPPLSGQTYVNNLFNNRQTDGMPRLRADNVDSKKKGGYFIDQNSGKPTQNAAYDTLSETAGLCVLCHGNNVNAMDYYTGSKLWVGTNGHSNSTVGGSGGNKSNLFDARRGVSNYMAMQNRIGDTRIYGPWQVRFGSWSNKGDVYNSGWYNGGTSGGGSAGGDYGNWYSGTGIGSYTGTAGAKAHNFTCSKCHSPHATGLPALLTTNCLDTGLSTWTNTTANPDLTPTLPQANNCHRKDPSNNGWHTLAPRQ